MSKQISSAARNLRGASILWAAVMWATAAVYANAPGDGFAGKWRLLDRQSVSGVDYSNGVPEEIAIAIRPGALDIERVSEGQRTQARYFENQPTESLTPNQNKRIGSIAWAGNHTGFVETVNIVPKAGGGAEALAKRIVYSWELAEGGETFTLLREEENLATGEKWSMRGTYGRRATTGDPPKGYQAMADRYRGGTLDYMDMPHLAKMAKERKDEELARQVAHDYIDHHLLGLKETVLYMKGNIEFIGEFTESSHDKSFRLFYPDGRRVNEAMKPAQAAPAAVRKSWDPGLAQAGAAGYAGTIVDQVVMAEEIAPFEKEAQEQSRDVPWDRIRETIAKKYSRQIADRNVVYQKLDWYMHRREWQAAISALVDKADKYGVESITGMADVNTITSLITAHCEDRRILRKAVKWDEYILQHNDPESRLANYSDYGVLLYKAGDVDEGIHYLEMNIKWMEENATRAGSDVHDDKNWAAKNQMVQKMKEGQKVDESWDLSLL